MKKERLSAVGSRFSGKAISAALLMGASSITCAQSLAQQADDTSANAAVHVSPGDLATTPLVAEVPSTPGEPTLPNAVAEHVAPSAPTQAELGLGYSMAHVTNGYGDWSGARLHGLYRVGNQTFIGELSELRRFGQRTTFGSFDYVRDFDADWFGAIGFSGTTSGTILPSERVDVSLNRKVLPERNLVLSLGAGYAWNRSEHRDQIYHAGVIWYALPNLIGEVGMNYNIDSPGSVKAPAYYAAVTYGTVGKSVLMVRGSFGREAYQAIGSASQIVGFSSNEVDVRWRYWVTKQWGAQVELNAYHNPYYDRRGFEIGVFRTW